MDIVFIQSPSIYKRNFTEFLPKDPSPNLSAESIAGVALRFFKVLSLSILRAIPLTLREIVPSFTYLVLRVLGTFHFYSAFFRVLYFVYCIGATFVKTAARLVAEEYSSSLPEVSRFVDRGIHLGHLRTKQKSLDTSRVPKELQVSELRTLFEQVNFTNPEAPGYMPPFSRKIDGKSYTVQEIRDGIDQFIMSVKHREPFVGTPRADDRVRLHAFYNQIEAAVRLSIYKVTQDLKNFEKKYSMWGNDSQDVDRDREFNNLLENRARLVIDLGVAGGHCGARYMGDSLFCYSNLYETEDGKGGAKTLEDALIELLANKRKELADREVEKYLVDDEGRAVSQSTHRYAQYFQQMGKLLALPDVENVIEHLSSSFETEPYLRSFFNAYNERFIIESVQEKIKTSQPFREQIIDWLKDQIGDWKPEGVLSVEESVKQIEEILFSPVDTTRLDSKIELLEFILMVADEVKPPFDPEKPWSDFVIELLSLVNVKKGLKYYPMEGDKWQCIREQLDLSQGILGDALKENYLSNGHTLVLGDEALQNRIIQAAKIEQMRRILPVEDDTLIRILEGKADLKEVVESRLKLSIETTFLQALDIESIAEEGLSPPVIEWLLDFHHIFIPKGGKCANHFRCNRVGIPSNFAENYFHLIDPQGWIAQVKKGEKEVAQPLLDRLICKERHLFGADAEVYALAFHFFEEAFESKREEIIQLVKTTFSKELVLPRSTLQKHLWVTLPEMGEAFFQHEGVKLFLLILVAMKSIPLANKLYHTGLSLADRVYHFSAKCVDKVPPFAFSRLQSLWKARQWVFENKWKVFFYSMVIRVILLTTPYPKAREIGRKIDPTIIFEGVSYLRRVWWKMFSNLLFAGWDVPNYLGQFCREIARRSKAESLKHERKGCLSLWLQTVDLSH